MPELPSAPALNAPLWVIFCHLILSRMLNSSAPPIFLLCLHLLALSNFLPLQEEHAPDPLSHVLCYVALLSLSAVYLSALLANLVKVHRSRYRASNLRHLPSNPRWRNNRPVPRVTRMTQPRFFFAGFSASALLFLPPRSPLSLPFPRSSSWLRFFRVFFSPPRPRASVLFLPPLLSTSIVIRRASGSADSAERINRLCRWYEEREGGREPSSSSPIGAVQLTSNVLLPSSSRTFLPFFLLCFRRIEDGRIRDSLGYRFTVINVDGGVEFARYPGPGPV